MVQLREKNLRMKGISDLILEIRSKIQELERNILELEKESSSYDGNIQEKMKEMNQVIMQRTNLQQEATVNEESVMQEKDLFQSRLLKVESLNAQIEK